MHVFIASVSAATSPTGVCRHAANVARGLLLMPEISKVTLCVGLWQENYFREAFGLSGSRLDILPVDIRNTSLARNAWFLFDMPRLVRDIAADITHLAYPIPVRLGSSTAPVVLSLHDLYPYDAPENFHGHAWVNRLILRQCLRQSDAIACVSEETRLRLRLTFPSIAPGRSMVIPNSVHLSGGPLLREPLIPAAQGSPFLLCVAQHRANKNLALLLRTFRVALDRGLLPHETRLVLVGRSGPETPLLEKTAAQAGISARVVFLSGITDAQLGTLYRECSMVVIPSLLEGFGLPVAEALSLGSQVVCSDIPSFRDIDNGQCIFFDPTDRSGESMLRALRTAARSPRTQMPDAVGSSPRDAAQSYAQLYATLLPVARQPIPFPVRRGAGSLAPVSSHIATRERPSA